MAELLSAGPFATAGERQAAAVLRGLPAGWIVICNKTLPTADGRSYELDFVVVGDHWVFVLDEKSWHGKIRGNAQQWVRANGFSQRSPLTKVDLVCKVLADYLRDRVPAVRKAGFFVRGGVLLSMGDQLPEIRDDPRVADGVFLVRDVCQRLPQVDSKQGSAVVGLGREEIKHCLVDLSDRPAIPEEIGPYKIEEPTTGRAGSRIFHAILEGGEPRILTVYDLGSDPLAAEERRDFYLREYRALQTLRDTGLVPEVKDPFPWSEDFLVVPIAPPPGKSFASYPLPDTRDDVLNELLLAATCFRGLAQIHARGALHRAIGPDAIYVAGLGSKPKIAFTNFFAARLQAGTPTIAVSLDALAAEDPYVAPEIASGYGNASAASDNFSLGLVFLERLARIPINELRPVTAGPVAIPDLLTRWPSLPEDVIAGLRELFQDLVAAAPTTNRPAAQMVASRFEQLAARLRLEGAEVEERMLDRRYRVERLLGQGAMARTYLAEDTAYGGFFALKCILYPAEVLPQARAEFEARRHVISPYLARIYDVYEPDKDVHVKMEYVPGPTLRDVEGEFPWSRDRWWAFAQDLMNAVETLENAKLLHRDIKPSNIILNESDGRPILIDFGLAVPAGSPHQPAGTFPYLPPEAVTAAAPPPSSDRYALAVVLFKALTGSFPFAPGDGSAHRIEVPPSVTDEKTRALGRSLLRALEPNPAARPSSVAELRSALQTAMLAADEPSDTRGLPELVNPWVDSLRGLYRNSDIGNADNRGLDTAFVRETYVPTTLDTQLLPRILRERPLVVFLTGNPGDGKTAFLEKVRTALQDEAVQGPADASGWELTTEGHVFRSCYDASEAHAGQTADEQLTAKLNGVQGSQQPAAALTVLIAINDGRLADYFERYASTFPWLARQVERARGADNFDSKPVWVVDLKRRAFVHLPGTAQPSVFARVLQRLVDPADWAICTGCAAKASCPMRNNALNLALPEVQRRIEYAFLLTHLRGQHHTTMRDLRSSLAYLITGNTSCQAVHAARQGKEGGAPLVDLAYWRSAFAPLERGDAVAGDLAEIDPARFPHPRLDRFLHFHRTPADANWRQRLFADSSDLPPERFPDEITWMGAMKRRLFFESDSGPGMDSLSIEDLPLLPWSTLLPYRYADQFLALLQGGGDLTQARVRLALGLTRSDGVNILSGDPWLSLRVTESDKEQLLVLKRFPVDEFTVRIPLASNTPYLETIPEVLVFEHVSGYPRLEVPLDLFELLMRLADGLHPTAPEYRPLLEDLVPFKSALLLRETQDLVLVDAARQTHLITQRNGKIVRVREDEATA